MRALCVMLLLLTLCAPLVSAETDTLYSQQVEAAGAGELIEQLPADLQELLTEMQFDPLDPTSYTDLDFATVTDMLWALLQRQSAGPLQVMGTLMGVVLVCALFTGWDGLGGTLRQTYHGVAVLGAGSTLLVPLAALLTTVQETVERVTVFLSSFIPVYAAVVAAGGRAVSALSYQTALLGACQLLVWLVRVVVFPLITVSLALGCTGSLTDGFCLDGFSGAIHKCVLWMMGLFSTVFSGLLSLQQMVAAAGDSLSGRVMKYSLTSFVPVVGGLLGEVYNTVVGCAGLLRSTVGGFGLLATVLILLPPLLSCICWSVGLHLAESTATLFGLTPIGRLCRTAGGAVRVLIALLAVFALVMVVSVSTVVFSAGR